jgi:hypothetical protein
MVNIQDLFDDAKYYQTVREMRWPARCGGVLGPVLAILPPDLLLPAA